MTYCEPFAGMLGVLLQRAPAGGEVINDLDERITTFWSVVRNSPEEFGQRIDDTPWAEAEFAWALEAQWDVTLPPLERARAFALVCATPHVKKDFQVGWGSERTPPLSATIWTTARNKPWQALADRLRNIVILQRDALDVLAQTARKEHVLLYVDPPYAETLTYAYAAESPEHDALRDVLLAQRGRVAISGYGEEWNDLGWRRYEFRARRTIGTEGDKVPASHRVEVVWTNYEAPQQGSFALEDTSNA